MKKQIKTTVTTTYIKEILTRYSGLLQKSEVNKLNNALNCLTALNEKSHSTKEATVIKNTRDLLISMNKEALTNYDYVLSGELYRVIKSIGKV